MPGTHPLHTAFAARSDPLLVDAARCGDVAQLRRLLAQGTDPDANLPRAHQEPSGGLKSAPVGPTTPLGMAAWQGHAAAVRLLLAAAADIDMPSAQGATPLQLAAEAGQPQTVELLLTAGADPNTSGTVGPALVLCAEGCIAQKGPATEESEAARLEVAQLLLAASAEVDVCRVKGAPTALQAAIRRRRSALADLLLNAGASSSFHGGEPTSTPRTDTSSRTCAVRTTHPPHQPSSAARAGADASATSSSEHSSDRGHSSARQRQVRVVPLANEACVAPPLRPGSPQTHARASAPRHPSQACSAATDARLSGACGGTNACPEAPDPWLLLEAVVHGDLEETQRLLQAGVDADYELTSERAAKLSLSSELQSARSQACLALTIPVLGCTSAHTDASPNSAAVASVADSKHHGSAEVVESGEGVTALLLAVHQGLVSVLKALLDGGAVRGAVRCLAAMATMPLFGLRACRMALRSVT